MSNSLVRLRMGSVMTKPSTRRTASLRGSSPIGSRPTSWRVLGVFLRISFINYLFTSTWKLTHDFDLRSISFGITIRFRTALRAVTTGSLSHGDNSGRWLITGVQAQPLDLDGGTSNSNLDRSSGGLRGCERGIYEFPDTSNDLPPLMTHAFKDPRTGERIYFNNWSQLDEATLTNPVMESYVDALKEPLREDSNPELWKW